MQLKAIDSNVLTAMLFSLSLIHIYRHRLPGAQGKRKEPEMGLQRIDARHHPLSVDKQRIEGDGEHQSSEGPFQALSFCLERQEGDGDRKEMCIRDR